MNKLAVLINGSSQSNGVTNKAMEIVESELKNQGIITEKEIIGTKIIRGCTGCGLCKKNQNEKCHINNDIVNPLLERMKEAGIIVVGSPTYFGGITSELKAFLDRASFVAINNGKILKEKPFGAFVTQAHAGGATAWQQLQVYSACNNMSAINTDTIPVFTHTLDKELIKRDKITAQILGQNLGRSLKK